MIINLPDDGNLETEYASVDISENILREQMPKILDILQLNIQIVRFRSLNLYKTYSKFCQF